MRGNIGDYIVSQLQEVKRSAVLERRAPSTAPRYNQNLTAIERAMRENEEIQRQAQAKEAEKRHEIAESERAQLAMAKWKPNFTQEPEGLSAIQQAIHRNEQAEMSRLERSVNGSVQHGRSATLERSVSSPRTIKRPAPRTAVRPFEDTYSRAYHDYTSGPDEPYRGQTCSECGKSAANGFIWRGKVYCKLHEPHGITRNSITRS